MRRVVIIAAIVLVGLGAGCITPSIPIPPPDPAQMSFTIDATAGTATFVYPPDHNYAGGTVYLFNHDLGVGTIQLVNANDSIGPMGVAAHVGDQIVVTVEDATQNVSRCIVLREGAQDPNTACAF